MFCKSAWSFDQLEIRPVLPHPKKVLSTSGKNNGWSPEWQKTGQGGATVAAAAAAADKDKFLQQKFSETASTLLRWVPGLLTS